MIDRPETPTSTDLQEPSDQGPGWLPAILAGLLLMAIGGFVCCGVSTWVLFQKRTELAVRTLRGSYLPALEQSLLEPEEKQAVVVQIEELARELESGKYENWQSAGVMQRLQRLPVTQWGELAAIEAFLRKAPAGDEPAGDEPAGDEPAGDEPAGDGDQEAEADRNSERDFALAQLSRLRRAVELGKVTSLAFEDLLAPVMVSDSQSPGGRRLAQPLEADAVGQVVERARQLADRGKVPDEMFDVSIDELVRREIQAGLTEGGY